MPLKIKTTGLMINEELTPDKEELIRIEFKHNFNILENTTIALFELDVMYFISREGEPDKKVFGCLVENYYNLPNLNEFRDSKGLLDFPINDFITIVSLSISHARAIVATHCLGTIFERTLVPIVDPIKATKSFIDAKKQEKGYPISFK